MEIKKIIKKYESEKADMRLRKEFYDGKHVPSELRERRIDGRKKTISVNTMVKNACDMYSGFIFKNKVKYEPRYVDTDTEGLDFFEAYKNDNNLEINDTKLFEDALLYGYGVEVANLESGTITFRTYDPKTWFFIFDENNNIKKAINEIIIPEYTYFRDEIIDKELKLYYVYDDQNITIYDKDESELEVIPHNFGEIPVNIYKISQEAKSFFSTACLVLCEQYDILSSAMCDDVKYAIDAFLFLKNVDISKLLSLGEDGLAAIQKLKEAGIMTGGENSDAEFLIRKIDTEKFRFALTHIRESIHRTLALPDLVDKLSGQQALNSISGVALSLMFLPMMQQAEVFFNYFREGVKKRIRLINRYLDLIGIPLVEDINIKVHFNLPQNNIEWMQNINNLESLISARDRLSLLPFVDNPDILAYNKEKEQELKNKKELESPIENIDVDPNLN